MGNSTAFLICFGLLVLVNFCREIEGERRVWGVHTINVRNSMPGTLVIRCASGDDDLGKRNLGHGQSFTWKFRANIWQTTLFFCRFWWGKKTTSLPVFISGWDMDDYHRTYNYNVNRDGIFLKYDNDKEGSIVGDWDGN